MGVPASDDTAESSVFDVQEPAISAPSAYVAGPAKVALLTLARAIAGDSSWDWLNFWPLGELGGILVGAGLLGIVWDYFDGKDKEARDTERLRRVLSDAAPEIRDAVVKGFAVNSDDLRRVATPELLDDIAANALGLRLGDAGFAREIYEDIRDQAVRAPERWYDVDIRIRLSCIHERSTPGAPRFDVTVQWEYTVAPSHAVQRFACVSDRDEFHELVTDTPATSTWFMTPRPGFHAHERNAFELLQYSVDGRERSIRRSERKTGQTYSVNIGEDVVREGKPVRISYVLRTVTPQSGHRLFFEIDQPSRGLSLELDYTDTDITHLSVTDLVASPQKTRIARLPSNVAAKVIKVDTTSWLLPKSGFAFVWTLADEERAGDRFTDVDEAHDADNDVAHHQAA